ncbi:MAG: acyl-CoA thioesterase [Bdellovibrio sp. CG10_big_fil_rev_8_21_14_0_10_47_8]|nr:MAG: acyl-CoA thioesterase [Bdellovibrio sp. CG10_big_fil_rev_8_21_14_0_10_47_8]
MNTTSHTVFQKEFRLRFRDADPAGILFFGHIFSLAHDAFEDFIQAAGFTWDEWFRTDKYMVPIRHAESNYLKPFLPGQIYTVRASVAKISQSSFQMRYAFQQNQNAHAEVLMVHTFLDQKSKVKIPVPELVRQRLGVYLESIP